MWRFQRHLLSNHNMQITWYYVFMTVCRTRSHIQSFHMFLKQRTCLKILFKIVALLKTTLTFHLLNKHILIIKCVSEMSHLWNESINRFRARLKTQYTKFLIFGSHNINTMGFWRILIVSEKYANHNVLKSYKVIPKYHICDFLEPIS